MSTLDQASRAWLLASEGALAASKRLLLAGHFRSAVSRCYYSAYSASHAICLLLDRRITGRWQNNWDHRAIEGELWGALAELTSLGFRDRTMYKNCLNFCQNERITADYRVQLEVNHDAAIAAITNAETLVRLARKVA